jgi:steroid delta-isomerase-like uncharacterized protein
MKTPRNVIEEWVAAFNYRDALRATALYHEDATNRQVAAGEPMVGRARIKEDLTSFFSAFPDNFTRIENLFEDGEWAIPEWFGGGTWKGEIAGMPPNGKAFALRGCGFFTRCRWQDQISAGLLG